MILFIPISALAKEDSCISCHKKITPNIVTDWQLSKHSVKEVSCTDCHGNKHVNADDYKSALIPTPETCASCHQEQFDQFKKGKHSMAWTAMKAMPTIHMQPMAMTEGMKGCGSCHKIGLKSRAEIEQLKKEGNSYGIASCDACHTRHTFSVKEAQQPQACQTCHMGFDHPQWEMYSGSKHGVRYLLKQNGTLPANTPAPTCQTCHMQNGNHEVRTGWGFLALRLPMPQDKQWADDRAVILKALGVLDPDGKATKRIEAVKAADIARLTEEDFQKERTKMIATCSNCHSKGFAEGELKKGDDMIRQADHLMADAINIVAALYKDGIIKKPKDYAYAYPDLLAFHDANTVIEQKLFVMFLEHRMRTFQGTFHANPDYAMWYGWSELRRDLTEIKELASQMRREKTKK